MDNNQIIEQLKIIIKPYLEDEVDLSTISNGTHLINDLNINSVHLVDIILDAEEAFDIEIDDDAAEQLITVGTAIEVISERINNND